MYVVPVSGWRREPVGQEKCWWEWCGKGNKSFRDCRVCMPRDVGALPNGLWPSAHQAPIPPHRPCSGHTSAAGVSRRGAGGTGDPAAGGREGRGARRGGVGRNRVRAAGAAPGRSALAVGAFGGPDPGGTGGWVRSVCGRWRCARPVRVPVGLAGAAEDWSPCRPAVSASAGDGANEPSGRRPSRMPALPPARSGADRILSGPAGPAAPGRSRVPGRSGQRRSGP
ncbi:hypothetical protein GCM10027168_50570 [Streptomyces capparidis]